jgi:serine protease inhibitor
MAMAMLAETTDGNSRQQILDLFGVDTIEQLRQQAGNVWNAHYSDDGETTLLLANSLWLDDGYAFKKQTAQLLADRYYASSFHGDLGTEKLDKQLQAWLNENTGDLLKDQAQKVTLDPQTVFALASTVYFSAGWDAKFSEGNTKDAVFHAPNGDITTPFMNKTMSQHTYYWGENYGAISLELTGDNRMWLILPDEGYTTTDILASEDYLRMTLDPGSWENKRTYKINLSLPKFDVVNEMDLIEGMKAMGVTDIFDYTVSDFTPMTDTPMLYVNQISHAARVTIDEKGCTAAAFTVINMEPGAMPPPELEEIDFVLDRPFLFIVSSRDNLPLFAGVVNEP